MPEKIIDFHIHSRYSRACSASLDLPHIAAACEQKGIDVVVTGDFTHPAWFAHIKENLTEERQGIYKLPNNSSRTRFILGTEVSCIYSDKDATRRVHLLILAPNIKAVENINMALEARGVNIRSDGRPIMGLSAKAVLQLVLDIDPKCMVVPAHAWTPWFAIFGSKSGYNSIEECFEELSPHIRAIETGLSSDPTMNHRLSKLDDITLISNSDAHSLDKLGREANVMQLNDLYTYDEIIGVISGKDKERFLYTIEFYPEEGKYHFDGHAPCKVSLSPRETKANKFLCPQCKKQVTVGVLHRVEDLADRTESEIVKDRFVPHKYIVPLKEIIASVYGVGVQSKKVAREYEGLITQVGTEFFILLHADIDRIRACAINLQVAEAVFQMRSGNITVIPGYDGIFGTVSVRMDKMPVTAQSKLL